VERQISNDHFSGKKLAGEVPAYQPLAAKKTADPQSLRQPIRLKKFSWVL